MSDLSNIKPRYHQIWTTDWNKAGNTKMNYLERSDVSKLWNEFNHNDIFNPELNYIDYSKELDYKNNI